MRGNVLRKRTGTSSQNSELKRGKIGEKTSHGEPL